jgi:hypothetical protein
MDDQIELHVQVSIEKPENGHRQAKLIRLPAKPDGEYPSECLTFRAWYPDQTVSDPATLTKSAHLATVWLYWPLNLPGEKTRSRIYRHLKMNIRRYLRLDEFARIALPNYHKSTGFYFVLDGRC